MTNTRQLIVPYMLSMFPALKAKQALVPPFMLYISDFFNLKIAFITLSEMALKRYKEKGYLFSFHPLRMQTHSSLTFS